MTDIEQIVGRLTKQQKFIILNAPVAGNWFPTCFEGWHWPWRSLLRMGLVYPREHGLQVLSPLALAVREYLINQQTPPLRGNEEV